MCFVSEIVFQTTSFAIFEVNGSDDVQPTSNWTLTKTRHLIFKVEDLASCTFILEHPMNALTSELTQFACQVTNHQGPSVLLSHARLSLSIKGSVSVRCLIETERVEL